MKTISLITAALALLPLTMQGAVSDYDIWNIDNYKGDTYTAADGSFMTYKVPDDYPLGNKIPPKFNVSINDEAYVGLYEDVNWKSAQMAFGYFNMADNASVTVKIACRKKFEKFDIYPRNLDISDISSTGGKSITFKINRPNQNLTLILDDSYQTTEVLHLFCNPIEEGPAVANPEKGAYYDKDTKTYYFGPGYHHMPDEVTISGPRSIYIAPGAVVNTRIHVNSLSTGRIYGHGILMMDRSFSGITVENSGNTGGTIEGIIINKRNDAWNVTFDRCKDMTIKNLKILSACYKSNDGVDMNYCSNINFDNCFIRANDDCVAIKGLAPEGSTSAQMPKQQDLHFTRMQLWSDSNNAFGLGAETVASAYENISLTDSDIIFDWDDIYNPEKLFYQSSLNICCMSGTYFDNIRYENIRLHHSDRVIGLSYIDNFYFGSIVTKQTDPGDMKNIVFKDIISYTNSGKSDSNEVRFEAWYGDDGTPRKAIHDITFDNVQVDGKVLESFDDPHIIHNNREGDELIYDIKFLNSSAGISAPRTETPAVKLTGSCLTFPEGTSQWAVYNTLGALVAAGTGNETDTARFTPGIYLLQFTANGVTANTKLKI